MVQVQVQPFNTHAKALTKFPCTRLRSNTSQILSGDLAAQCSRIRPSKRPRLKENFPATRLTSHAEPDTSAQDFAEAFRSESDLEGSPLPREGQSPQGNLPIAGSSSNLDQSSAAIDGDSPSSTTPSQVENMKGWQQGWHLTEQTAKLVWPNAWQLLVLFALCDGLNFLLVRICHRITNEVALRFLLPPGLASASNMGSSLWYLTNNPDISNFRTGYLWMSGVMLVVMLPLSILLRTISVSTAQLIVSSQKAKKEHPGWRPPVRILFKQMREHTRTVVSSLQRLWQVDLLVTVQALPLQGLCLLFLPLPWSFPRLLNLQLASPIALFAGEKGKQAIQSAKVMVQPLRGSLAYPFVGLLMSARLIAIMGETFFVKILSPRIAREIPEIPLAVFAIVSLSTLALKRMSDLLPYVAYQQAKDLKEHAKAV